MFTAIQSEFSAESEILNLAGWLRTVAGRRIADHYRAVSRVQHLLPQNHNSRSDCAGADPAKHQELQETRQLVRRAMDSMPEQYRMALEWKYLDQLSVREIAARWKMTEKAVESILFRARREFRDQMTQRELMEPSRNGSRSRIPDSTSNDSAKEDASSQVL
jgi:RNA polymerase sigma factor (sigma-70 family)